MDGYTKIEPKKITKKRSIKKLLMYAFICFLVYVVFYAVTNREHIFSEEFRSEIGLFLTEKTNIAEFYNNSKKYIQNKFSVNDENNTKETENSDENKENEINKNVDNEKEQNKDSNEKKENSKDKNKDENIGGDSKEISNIDKKNNDNSSEQEIMEKDAKEIKSKISFITPVNGRISSTFGWRNPTVATVPKYHTGLDISASEGTKIKSATDGKVIMASSEGDYGKHYQIQIKDVIIIYAHCKKLYLKKGDIVKQGQEIAEVGNTGNSTGPHLHFEIRRKGRKIDPQLIINI